MKHLCVLFSCFLMLGTLEAFDGKVLHNSLSSLSEKDFSKIVTGLSYNSSALIEKECHRSKAYIKVMPPLCRIPFDQ